MRIDEGPFLPPLLGRNQSKARGGDYKELTLASWGSVFYFFNFYLFFLLIDFRVREREREGKRERETEASICCSTYISFIG